MTDSITFYKQQAKEIRQNIVKMIYQAKAAHIGGALSVVDILTILYFKVLKIKPKKSLWPDRDWLVLSKGHAASALYATLAQRGFFDKALLKNYYVDGSTMAGHPIKGALPGVEVSTGSLGHGLSIGLGLSLAYKRGQKKNRVFVVLSEGDCDSGSTWEAAMMAAHLKLDNLIAVIDYNKIQALGRSKEILELEPLKEKWQAFGWATKEVNGHDYRVLLSAFSKIPFRKNQPSVVIAHTVKGKGVSFMEDSLDWHYLSPNDQQLNQALKELNL